MSSWDTIRRVVSRHTNWRDWREERGFLTTFSLADFGAASLTLISLLDLVERVETIQIISCSDTKSQISINNPKPPLLFPAVSSRPFI